MTDEVAPTLRQPNRRRGRRRSHGGGRTDDGSFLPLKLIDVGEPDANAEYFLAKRANVQPMFVRAYYNQNSSLTDELEKGNKFLLSGRKGTGKTAILRHLENVSTALY